VTIPTVCLSSGWQMPVLGLGTWRLSGETCTRVVRKALELGYCHLDTAEMYGNHRDIARAIKGFDRASLFITSKVPPGSLRHRSVHRMCEKALRELGTDYLDLYLIHWPNPDVPMEETFRALAELQEQGKVRSIGVSNFSVRRLTEAVGVSEAPIVTNQIEFHPLLYQRELLEFCRSHGVVVTAYCPLARGAVLRNEVITELARKHGRTPAQIALRWLVQKGIVVIPKTSSEERLRENMAIFDWSLPAENEREIDDIGESARLIDSPLFAEDG
jgi:2,5-diketo-D-gluconate reductase B